MLFRSALIKIWDGLYNDQETAEIWRVLDAVQERCLWDTDERVGSATLKTENKRQGRGVWLGSSGRQELPDDLHGINEILMKLYDGPTSEYASEGMFERGILLTNSHQNLLSYYENGDHYKAHWDSSPYTALTWFCREPQAFSGGDLFLPEINETVPFKNHRTVLFPGHVWHEVTPVRMPEELSGQNLGRFCISQFLRIDSHLHQEAKNDARKRDAGS